VKRRRSQFQRRSSRLRPRSSVERTRFPRGREWRVGPGGYARIFIIFGASRIMRLACSFVRPSPRLGSLVGGLPLTGFLGSVATRHPSSIDTKMGYRRPSARLPEVLSGTLTTRLQVYRCVGFTAARLPQAFCTIYDTGMANPDL